MGAHGQHPRPSVSCAITPRRSREVRLLSARAPGSGARLPQARAADLHGTAGPNRQTDKTVSPQSPKQSRGQGATPSDTARSRPQKLNSWLGNVPPLPPDQSAEGAETLALEESWPNLISRWAPPSWVTLRKQLDLPGSDFFIWKNMY